MVMRSGKWPACLKSVNDEHSKRYTPLSMPAYDFIV